jgi:microcystin-dependent protein
MAYPPTVPPNTRADNTPLPTNHADDHNDISNAFTDIINVLGSAPDGGEASLTALLDLIDPADKIIAVGGATAPTGWAICDGTAVSRTTYAATFARIGTIHGVGDGTTTFNLPDLRSRFIAGKGTATWSDTVAETGGSEDTVAVAHTHTFVHDHDDTFTANQSTHTHDAANYGSGTETVLTHLSTFNGHDAYVPHDLTKTAIAPAGYTNMAVAFGSALESVDPTITVSGAVSNNPGTDETAGQDPSSSGTDTNLPPYLTLNYCIRLR